MGWTKRLTSVTVALCLVLTMIGTSLAAPTPVEANAAYDRLEHFGIVQGVLMPDGTTSRALDMTLTRAQLVTIIVRAFGEEETARILQGATTFPDVPGSHWSSGYVAVAQNIAAQHGFPLGYPDGSFQPERTVTVIEALTFVMKFLGVQVGTGDDWVNQTINSAVTNGVITADQASEYRSEANVQATRGMAFAMADSIFYNYAGFDGKSVYQQYHDNVAPVVTLDPLPANTSEASITVTGTVSSDADKLFVGPDQAAVGSDGRFSVQVSLEPGVNEIEVTVTDKAGNVGTAKATVSRGSGVASKIVASLPDRNVKAGETVPLEVKIVDDAGIDTGLTGWEVTVGGDIGTYEDGKFTAGGKLGRGTITVTYGELRDTINVTIVAGDVAKVEAETSSVAPGTSVRLYATDAFGNRISGAVFSKDHPDVFIDGDRFIATKPGQYTVTATKDGKTGTGVISVYGEHKTFTIEAPEQLVANESAEYTINVYAADEDGNWVREFEGLVTLETNVDIVGASTVEAKNGVATFRVRIPYGMDGLDAEFTAYYEDGDEVIEGHAAIEIASQVAAALEFDTPKYLAINQPAFEGNLRILDQGGSPIEWGDVYEVTLTISGPAYFAENGAKELRVDISGSMPFELIPVDRYTEGTITLRATAPGLKSASATVEAVYAMAPRTLKWQAVSEESALVGEDEDGYEFRLGLEDRNGVPVQADQDLTVTLTFDIADPADKLIVSYQDKDGLWTEVGYYSWDGKRVQVPFEDGQRYLPIRVQSKVTGNIKVTAAASGLTSASGTVAFAAGDPVKITFDKPAFDLLANTEYVITAQLRDNNDNPVAKSGIKVTFSSDKPEYTRLNGTYNKDYTTTTDAQGRASVRVYLLNYSNEFTLTATADLGDDDWSEEVDLNIVPSVARTITVETWVDGKNRVTFEAGQPVEVRVKVTDNHGVKWADNQFADRLVLSGIDGDEPENVTFSWDPDGYFVTTISIDEVGSYTLVVSDGNVINGAQGRRNVTVVGGEPVGVSYVGSDLSYKKGDPTEITLVPVDAAGNRAGSTFDNPVDFTVRVVDGDGQIRATRDGVGYESRDFTFRAKTSSMRIWFISDSDSITLEFSSPGRDFTVTFTAKD